MAIRTTEAEWSRPFHKGRTEAEVPGIDEKTFQEQAEFAKVNCPVSKALTGVEIGLEARLTQRGRLNMGISS
jgi:organic hydroperoxide reductase OsmC/OhrA